MEDSLDLDSDAARRFRATVQSAREGQGQGIGKTPKTLAEFEDELQAALSSRRSPAAVLARAYTLLSFCTPWQWGLTGAELVRDIVCDQMGETEPTRRDEIMHMLMTATLPESRRRPS